MSNTQCCFENDVFNISFEYRPPKENTTLKQDSKVLEQQDQGFALIKIPEFQEQQQQESKQIQNKEELLILQQINDIKESQQQEPNKVQVSENQTQQQQSQQQQFQSHQIDIFANKKIKFSFQNDNTDQNSVKYIFPQSFGDQLFQDKIKNQNQLELNKQQAIPFPNINQSKNSIQCLSEQQCKYNKEANCDIENKENQCLQNQNTQNFTQQLMNQSIEKIQQVNNHLDGAKHVNKRLSIDDDPNLKGRIFKRAVPKTKKHVEPQNQIQQQLLQSNAIMEQQQKPVQDSPFSKFFLAKEEKEKNIQKQGQNTNFPGNNNIFKQKNCIQDEITPLKQFLFINATSSNDNNSSNIRKNLFCANENSLIEQLQILQQTDQNVINQTQQGIIENNTLFVQQNKQSNTKICLKEQQIQQPQLKINNSSIQQKSSQRNVYKQQCDYSKQNKKIESQRINNYLGSIPTDNTSIFSKHSENGNVNQQSSIK